MLAPKHHQAFNQKEGKREIQRLGLRFCLPQNEVEMKTSCDTRKVETGSAPMTWSIQKDRWTTCIWNLGILINRQQGFWVDNEDLEAVGSSLD